MISDLLPSSSQPERLLEDFFVVEYDFADGGQDARMLREWSRGLDAFPHNPIDARTQRSAKHDVFVSRVGLEHPGVRSGLESSLKA